MSTEQANVPAVLGTIQVLIDHGDPWSNKLRALRDSGSQVNLITLKAARKLGFSIEKSLTRLVGVESSPHKSYGSTFLPLKLPGEENPHYEKFHVVARITGRLPVQLVSLENYPEFHNLEFADPKFGIPSEIDALLGIGLWIKIVERGLIKSNDTAFAAQKTIFGWVIYRRADDIEVRDDRRVLHINTTQANSETDISVILQQFWKAEEVPAANILKPTEKRCEKIFMETHQRDENGRYIVQIPFQ